MTSATPLLDDADALRVRMVASIEAKPLTSYLLTRRLSYLDRCIAAYPRDPSWLVAFMRDDVRGVELLIGGAA